MKRLFICFVVLYQIFSGTFCYAQVQNISSNNIIASISDSLTILNNRIYELESTIIRLNGNVDSLNTHMFRLAKKITITDSDIERSRQNSIESLNRSLTTTQWVSGFIIAFLVFCIVVLGFWGIKEKKMIPQRVENFLNKEAINVINKKAINVIENMLLKNETEITNIKKDLINLRKNLNSILKTNYYFGILYQLLASENEQLIAISYIIANPMKDDSIVISFLSKLRDSDNPRIRAQSMLARHNCGDETALSELDELKKSDVNAMRKAAEEAQEEIEESQQNDENMS